MKRCTVVLLGGLIAMSGSVAARDIQLTVYNENLGLVGDVRELDLQKNRTTVAIRDVASEIDPTSVHLKSLERDAGIIVLEQNYRYDLASPDRILERYLGNPIQVVLEKGELHEGTLQSFGGGQLVLLSAGGLSMLQRDKIVDIRFPSLPEGLITKPTLVWDVMADRDGRQKAELSYLTHGISWHAEYVAITNEDDTQADLAAWVSIDNQSGTDYPDALLQLIAGEVNVVQPEMKRFARDRVVAMSAGPSDAGFEEESFFEYHLYTLPRPATVRDRETKQIALFTPTVTAVDKLYEYRPWQDEKKIRIVLQFENRKDRGLGMPLPKGKVRTYKRDSRGGQQFVGEDRIDHTPRDEKVRLGLGNAFDVVAERTVKDTKRISQRVQEMTIEVRFRNHKETPVTIVAQERFWGDWKILTESHPSTKKDARTAEWTIEVDADAEVVLNLTARLGS